MPKKNQKNLEKIATEEEIKILKKLKREGISPKELLSLAKALKCGNPSTNISYNVGKNTIKYGLISDTHIGNIHYDKNLMTLAAKEFSKEQVDFIIHAGDIIDGWYQNRPQSIFEQNAVGLDQQFKMAVQELSKLEQKLLFITGNHEFNTYMRGAGVEIGPYLEDKLKSKRKDAKFLGNGEGEIRLKNGIVLETLHPDGGIAAYAISYKPQRIVEALSAQKDIDVLHLGHYHKAEYLFYRNTHVIQAGTLEGQTKFMKGKNIAANKGFWIIELYSGEDPKIDKIKFQFYPAYS